MTDFIKTILALNLLPYHAIPAHSSEASQRLTASSLKAQTTALVGSTTGMGDGYGNETGNIHAGQWPSQKARALDVPTCKEKPHRGLRSGNNVAWHPIYSTARVMAGPQFSH